GVGCNAMRCFSRIILFAAAAAALFVPLITGAQNAQTESTRERSAVTQKKSAPQQDSTTQDKTAPQRDTTAQDKTAPQQDTTTQEKTAPRQNTTTQTTPAPTRQLMQQRLLTPAIPKRDLAASLRVIRPMLRTNPERAIELLRGLSEDYPRNTQVLDLLGE
ncbi:MAG: hypothetical protein P8181_07115, partial [bacterium]